MIQTLRLLGIVLLALGAIGTATAADEKTKSTTAADEKTKSKRGRPKYENLESGPFYMQLEGITVPKIQGNTVERLLTYILVVEFADAETRERAKLIMPRLMDAFVRDLHILSSRPGTAEEGVDLAVVKRYLIASGGRVMGPDAVKDVLVERTIARKAG
jgi:flagellar basal body-associated protein FliL